MIGFTSQGQDSEELAALRAKVLALREALQRGPGLNKLRVRIDGCGCTIWQLTFEHGSNFLRNECQIEYCQLHAQAQAMHDLISNALLNADTDFPQVCFDIDKGRAIMSAIDPNAYQP